MCYYLAQNMPPTTTRMLQICPHTSYEHLAGSQSVATMVVRRDNQTFKKFGSGRNFSKIGKIVWT